MRAFIVFLGINFALMLTAYGWWVSLAAAYEQGVAHQMQVHNFEYYDACRKEMVTRGCK